ncbi:unnamed protein product [Musa hybrid cultivar]
MDIGSDDLGVVLFVNLKCTSSSSTSGPFCRICSSRLERRELDPKN